MRFLVLGKRSYNFKNRDGEVVSGVTVHYCDLEPVANQHDLGYLPMKATLPMEQDSNLKKVPGIYEVDFTFQPDSRGKPVLRWRAVKFVADASIR